MCLVIGLLVLCIVAQAGMRGPLTVVASNANGKWASWSWNWGNSPGYTLGAPVELRSSDNTLLGKINNLSCSMAGDPFLTLNFDVQAVGNANFFFDTGELLFPTIDQAVAFATAAMTLTADGNGGTVTGLFPGGKAYEATYNSGTVFADLDSTFSALPNTSATQNDRVPPGLGNTLIPVPVSSMRAQWSFNLTDGDGASGTSRYEIQPVPDAGTFSLALSGAAPLLAGLALRRRRRV